MNTYWSKVLSSRISRRRALAGTAALSGAGLAAAVVGCGGGDGGSKISPGASPSSQDAGPPKRGGRFGYWSIPTANLNPVTNWTEGHFLSGAVGGVYDRLISSRVAGDKHVIMEAAEGYEQPESLRLVFKLKPGMVFQNVAPVAGRAVKAEDVVKSQLYTKAQAAAENDFQRNVMDTVEAPDDRTVVFKLKRPNAYIFTSSLMTHPGSMAIMPQEILDKLDTNQPIGSGPYQAVDWVMNNRYKYRRFDGFRGAKDGLPYVDEREIFVLLDPVALEAAFRSEQIHVFEPPPGTADRVAGDLTGRAVKDTFNSLYPFTFNFGMASGRGPWVTDVRVRQAFYRIINRQQFADLVLRGLGVVPPGLLATTLTDWQVEAKDTAQFFKNDQAEFKQLMSAAAFAMDKELELIMNNTPTNQQAAQVLQQQLTSAGLKIRITPLTFPEFLPRTQRGDWDLHIGRHPDYDSPGIPLRQAGHHDSRSQFANSGLTDPEIEKMVEKSEEAVDRTENIKLVKQLQMELLKKYSPYVNLMTHRQEYIRNAKLQGWSTRDPSQSAAGLHMAEIWFSA